MAKRNPRNNSKGLIVLIAVLTVVAAVCLLSSKASAKEPAREKSYHSVEISIGDTLWSLAEAYKPADGSISTADYVEQLRKVNDLKRDDLIKAGHYLTVINYQ